MRRNPPSVLLLACAASFGTASAGCGSLKVTKLAASTQRPANVALYLNVRDGSGNGIPDLKETDFRVYEDGKLLPPTKAKRALIEPRSFGVKFTLVLIDLSGPVADSEDLPELAATVGHFVEHLAEKQQVAVTVFDGNDEVAPFLGFGADGAQIPGLVEGLRKFRPRSRNTNWNGAVYQGLNGLEEQLSASTVPQKSAALVVFTDRGTDLAHTVSVETVRQKIEASPVEIYVIGVGEKVNAPELNAVGRSGVFLSSSLKAYKKGFDEVSGKLTSDTDGRYVFSYCSPKRKGDHKAEVEIVAPAGAGKVAYQFNAAGFKTGCSPKKRPTFSDADNGHDRGEDRGQDRGQDRGEKGEEKAEQKGGDKTDALPAQAAPPSRPPAAAAAVEEGQPAKPTKATKPDSPDDALDSDGPPKPSPPPKPHKQARDDE